MSKKGEAILLAAGLPMKKGPPGHDEPDGGEPDDMPEEDGLELSEGEKTAAEDAMVALKDEDAEAFGKALKRFTQMGG